jgi:hypothetical protein
LQEHHALYDNCPVCLSHAQQALILSPMRLYPPCCVQPSKEVPRTGPGPKELASLVPLSFFKFAASDTGTPGLKARRNLYKIAVTHRRPLAAPVLKPVEGKLTPASYSKPLPHRAGLARQLRRQPPYVLRCH